MHQRCQLAPGAAAGDSLLQRDVELSAAALMDLRHMEAHQAIAPGALMEGNVLLLAPVAGDGCSWLQAAVAAACAALAWLGGRTKCSEA